MGRTVLLAVGATVLVPMLAWADVPPPPDTYSGPSTVHVAGLTFERRENPAQGYWHYLGATLHDTNPLDFRGYWVFLTACDAGHPNCRLVRKAGMIGAAVSTVNRKDVSASADGDSTALQDAFESAGDAKVSLKFLLARGDKPPRPLKTVTLAVSPR